MKPQATVDVADTSSSTSLPPAKEITVIHFSDDDPESPYNMSKWQKQFIVFAGVCNVMNSTFGSALPSNAMTQISTEFDISTHAGNPELNLPIAIYLVGFIFGPLLFSPLSEIYGRRPIMLGTFVGYTAFTLGCALAPNWTGFIIFRFFCGIFASAPLTVVGGIMADIYKDPVARGRAMAAFMTMIVIAPIVSPIVAGYISVVFWRWTFWIGLIVAGVSWVPLLFLPETYGPTLLVQRASSIRRAAKKAGEPNPEVYAPLELDAKTLRHIFGVVLARPIRMFCTELIVIAVCLYLSVAYAIFYMYFQTYAIVFKEIYGMSAGVMGLMFLPIGLGSFIGFAIFLLYDSYLARSRKANKAWTQKEESRRLPLACIGGPMYVIALFWLGWTAREDIPWIVPCLAGVPFGIGLLLIFIALLNYLGDAYKAFSASAMAAAACTRSLVGAVMVMVSAPMYEALGLAWGTSLLGFASLGMCVIPFLFIYYGDAIRAKSSFCQMLNEKQ